MDKEVIYPDLPEESRKATGTKRAKVKVPKAQMTKSEKINTVISLCALLIAVASPFITYFWLDPQIQSFRHRGRLEVTPIIQSLPTDSSGNLSKDAITYWLTGGYEFEVMNIGDLPAKDVSIVLQYEDPATDEVKVESTPPLLMESSISGNRKFITLKYAIAPHNKVIFNLSKVPRSIWVSNEFGERSVLSGPAIPWILTSKDGRPALGGGSNNDPTIWYLWNAKTGQWDRNF